jgi:hypothetical protein
LQIRGETQPNGTYAADDANSERAWLLGEPQRRERVMMHTK